MVIAINRRSPTMHYSCRAARARDVVRITREKVWFALAFASVSPSRCFQQRGRTRRLPALPPPRPFLASRSPFLVGALVIDVNRAALYAFREFFSRSAIRTFSKRDCQIRRPSHGESLDAPRVVIGHDRPIGAFVFCVASITGRVAQFLLVA